jgi:hypothetical protein
MAWFRNVSRVMLLLVVAVFVVRSHRARHQSSLEFTRLLADNAADCTPIGDVRFSGEPLGAVIQELTRRSGVPIAVDWRSLELAGIDRESPVEVELQSASLLGAICEVAEAIGRGTARVIVSHEEHGYLIAARDPVVEPETYLRVYDVRDLLADVEPAGREDGRTTDYQLYRLRWQPAGAVFGRGPFRPAVEGLTEWDPNQLRAEMTDCLFRRIPSFPDPHHQYQQGSSENWIEMIDGRIWYFAGPRAQALLEGRLASLRAHDLSALPKLHPVLYVDCTVGIRDDFMHNPFSTYYKALDAKAEKP